jgi:hypothetical protein
MRNAKKRGRRLLRLPRRLGATLPKTLQYGNRKRRFAPSLRPPPPPQRRGAEQKEEEYIREQHRIAEEEDEEAEIARHNAEMDRQAEIARKTKEAEGLEGGRRCSQGHLARLKEGRPRR